MPLSFFATSFLKHGRKHTCLPFLWGACQEQRGSTNRQTFKFVSRPLSQEWMSNQEAVMDELFLKKLSEYRALWILHLTESQWKLGFLPGLKRCLGWALEMKYFPVRTWILHLAVLLKITVDFLMLPKDIKGHEEPKKTPEDFGRVWAEKYLQATCEACSRCKINVTKNIWTSLILSALDVRSYNRTHVRILK